MPDWGAGSSINDLLFPPSQSTTFSLLPSTKLRDLPALCGPLKSLHSGRVTYVLAARVLVLTAY